MDGRRKKEGGKKVCCFYKNLALSLKHLFSGLQRSICLMFFFFEGEDGAN